MEKYLVNVTKKSTIVFLGKIISVLLGFIFSFVVARFMGAEIYGRFTYVYTFISLLPIIANLGLDKGLISFIPRLNSDDKVTDRNSIITFSFTVTILISILLIITLINYNEYIANNILNNPDLSTLIIWSAPILVLLIINKISKGVFRGIDIIRHYVIGKNIIIPITKTIIIVILSLFSYKVYGVLISYYISTGLTSSYYIYILWKMNYLGKVKKNNIKLYKKLLKFSLPLLFTGMLGFLISRSDSFMIGYFLSEDKVGIYNIARKVGTMSSFILTAFNMVFASTISKLYYENRMDDLKKIYTIITKWIFSFNLLFLVNVVILNKEIMLLFGKEFLYGNIALLLITIGQFFNALVGSAGYINTMTGYPQFSLYTNLITVIINIFLNLILIPRIGIEGAAIATLISILVSNVLRLSLLYSKHKIHPYNKDYIKISIFALFSFIISYLLKNYFEINWIVEIFIISVLSSAIFLVLYVSYTLSSEDKMIINKFKNKIFK